MKFWKREKVGVSLSELLWEHPWLGTPRRLHCHGAGPRRGSHALVFAKATGSGLPYHTEMRQKGAIQMIQSQ